MEKRNYMHGQALLPEIKAMLAGRVKNFSHFSSQTLL